MSGPCHAGGSLERGPAGPGGCRGRHPVPSPRDGRRVLSDSGLVGGAAPRPRTAVLERARRRLLRLAGVLRESSRAPGLVLGDGVELPDDVELGAHVIIHAGTVVGASARLQDGAVLGKPPALGARSTASRQPPPPLVVGAGVTIGAGAVVLSGARIGPRAVVGDHAHVRERAVIGEETVVGRASAVDRDVAVGARVRIQTGCYLTAFSIVEDDVFVAPGVFTTNDHAMARHPPQHRLSGAILRRACRVGGRAVLLPGVEIGEEAFVAAGSVVTRTVAPRAVVMGSPARVVGTVAEEDLLERWA